MYVHGFMSAGSTHTAQILRDLMPGATVIVPDLPIHPEEAMDLLHKTVDTERPDLVIGASMGGMYTEMLYGDYLISPNLSDSGLGTGIAFGSDEFKTWEEVITYFGRLGGQ